MHISILSLIKQCCVYNGKGNRTNGENITTVNFIYVTIYSVNHGAKPWRGEGRRDDVYKHELPESSYSEE